MKMSFSTLKNLIKQYGLFYLIALIILAGLKLFYKADGSDDLKWLLSPTAWWVSALSGIAFENVPGVGYVSHSLRFIIARSCSGFQFMIITAAALIFSFFHRAMSARRASCGKLRRLADGLGWIVVGFSVSFILTIMVNGLRILLSIRLPLFLEQSPFFRERNIPGGWLTPDRLHTLIGVGVYFTSLLAICRLMHALTLKLFRSPVQEQTSFGRKAGLLQDFLRLLQPVFWYFFFVLGIPVLSRPWRNESGAFADYTALVLSVCGAALALFFLADTMKRRIRNHRIP